MKTFRELISWELEQDSKGETAEASLPGDNGAGKLNASVLRKLRYLNSSNVAAQKGASAKVSSSFF